MGTQVRLKDNSRHTLEAIFHVMRVAVNYRKGQKHMKKKWSNFQRVPWPDQLSTTERNLKCSQLLLQAIQWASRRPGNFFVQPDKKFLEESTKAEKTYLLTIFGEKSKRKIHSWSKFASKLTAAHTAQYLSQFKCYASL